MKNHNGLRGMVFTVAMVLMFITIAVADSESLTVEGTIINYQLVAADGQVYEIAVNDVGDQLVEFVDTRVRVTGFVEDEDGIKVLTVSSYEVLRDNS